MTAPTQVERAEPTLAELAQRLIDAGTPWREAAVHIESQAAGDRESLQAAVLHWLNTMRRRPSDDFAAGRVLRALERALAATPRPPQVS